MMPKLTDYDRAVAHLSISALDPELATGMPQWEGTRLVAYTGGVSRVYPVQLGDRTVALRCWYKRADRQADRYRHLASLFSHVRLSYFAEVRYIESGLRVGDGTYPVVWMEWIHAPPLNEFLDRHASSRARVERVAEGFASMVADLHRYGIAHGDLQDGNILVQGDGNALSIRLVDYDTLYAPTFGYWENDAVGMRDYQHPLRSRLQFLSSEDDYFSELVIYLSLCAIAEDPSLWKAGNEGRLLFSDRDFADPDRSPTFDRLSRMSGEVSRLNKHLRDFCRSDPTRLQPLEKVISEGLLVERYFDRRVEPAPPAEIPAPPPPEDPDRTLEKYFGPTVRAGSGSATATTGKPAGKKVSTGEPRSWAWLWILLLIAMFFVGLVLSGEIVL
jgi:hypothetical protein